MTVSAALCTIAPDAQLRARVVDEHRCGNRHSVEVSGIIFFFQAEDGIRDIGVTGVQTCALPISSVAVIWQISKFHLKPCLNSSSPFGSEPCPIRSSSCHNRWRIFRSHLKLLGTRSEERRVGKEGRSRWSPYH